MSTSGSFTKHRAANRPTAQPRAAAHVRDETEQEQRSAERLARVVIHRKEKSWIERDGEAAPRRPADRQREHARRRTRDEDRKQADGEQRVGDRSGPAADAREPREPPVRRMAPVVRRLVPQFRRVVRRLVHQPMRLAGRKRIAGDRVEEGAVVEAGVVPQPEARIGRAARASRSAACRAYARAPSCPSTQCQRGGDAGDRRASARRAGKWDQAAGATSGRDANSPARSAISSRSRRKPSTSSTRKAMKSGTRSSVSAPGVERWRSSARAKPSR